MAAFLDTLAADGKLLWLDYTAYAGKLLANNKIPWLDVTNFISWQRKAQGLLKADVVPVPLAPLIEAWLAAHPELAKAMGEKKRALFPLKALLADAALRAHLVDLLGSLRSSFGKLPMALVLPSPRRWIALAYAQANGSADGIDIGADEVDSASVYVADFLRAFGEIGINALLLEEAADNQPSVAELEWYQPVINVAAHYRWDVGLRLPGAAADLGKGGGLGFVIATAPIAGVPTGVAAAPAFWTGAAAPACPAGGFRFAEVPADANPEKVLDLLGALRS
ncbi:MAG: hypothetical protein JWR16_1935 [Nevskia sp.]|nr:hypothetical protein [Nevskia sp.]